MKAGLSAPSGCNKQTTSLIAVDDQAILNKLHSVINPPVGETAPAMICVLTQRIPAYREKCFAVQDYSAAIENMLLRKNFKAKIKPRKRLRCVVFWQGQ